MDEQRLAAVVNQSDGWDLRKRGDQDAHQHDKRVQDAIKKNLKNIVGEEAIITSDGTRRIRIPLRYLDQYRFRYGNPQNGVGQGQGQPGDVLGRRSGDDKSGDGSPGDQPGENTYDVDVPVEDIARYMLDDMSLPWLEQKPQKEVKTIHTEYTDRRKKGPWALFDKKASLKKNALRHAAKRDLLPGHAIGKWNEDDLQFRASNDRPEMHANAAVYMIMDRSGSMTTNKKFIARAFFFWMVMFLRIKYRHVETVFIAHDTEAQVVPEKDFFTLSNNGGTRCSSALQLAVDLMKQFHQPSVWNTYVFDFSDGDNLPNDNALCKTLTLELLGLTNMVGYGEIRYRDDASFYGWLGSTSSSPSSLQAALNEVKNDAKIANRSRLVVETIQKREEVYAILQKFLLSDQAQEVPKT